MFKVTEAESYQNLANAIIEQAAKDYILGYRRDECLNFFHSGWYRELTHVPAHVILKECDRRIKEKRLHITHSNSNRAYNRKED